MRLMGIDYGSKKVGIAVSDEEGRLAFPRTVLPTDRKLLPAVVALIGQEEVGAVVMGESRNYQGAENAIMQRARAFAEALTTATGCAVHFESEALTTKAAERLQGSTDMTDASAAALILQSYLDKHQNHGGF